MSPTRNDPRPRRIKDGAIQIISRYRGRDMCYIKGCERKPLVKQQVFPFDVIAWMCTRHAEQYRPPNERGE